MSMLIEPERTQYQPLKICQNTEEHNNYNRFTAQLSLPEELTHA